MNTLSSLLALGDQGSGRPLVLIHAFPFDRKMWGVQTVLASQARLITPDLFGFGESPLPPEGWTVDMAADALAQTLTQKGISDRIVLGGLSLGGYVALAFARRHADRLAGLILADTKAEPDTTEGKATRNQTIETVRAQGVASLIPNLFPKLLGNKTLTERPEVVQVVRRLVLKQSVEGVTAALAALRDRPDATPGLAEIRVPTLVIVGAEDAITPPSVARAMTAAIPDARLEVIPNVGHLSNLEDWTTFNKLVGEFLKSLP